MNANVTPGEGEGEGAAQGEREAQGEGIARGAGAGAEAEARWPELFERLEPVARRAVGAALDASGREGWRPNRADVANLTDYACGDIDTSEYDRRAATLGEAHPE